MRSSARIDPKCTLACLGRPWNDCLNTDGHFRGGCSCICLDRAHMVHWPPCGPIKGWSRWCLTLCDRTVSPGEFAHQTPATHVKLQKGDCLESTQHFWTSFKLADRDLYTFPSVGDLWQMVVITGYYTNLTRSVRLKTMAGGDRSPICGNQWLPPQSSTNDGRATREKW